MCCNCAPPRGQGLGVESHWRPALVVVLLLLDERGYDGRGIGDKLDLGCGARMLQCGGFTILHALPHNLHSLKIIHDLSNFDVFGLETPISVPNIYKNPDIQGVH